MWGLRGGLQKFLRRALRGRQTRVENMVAQMDLEELEAYSNVGSCAAECPVGITMENITSLNREYLVAKATSNHLA